jgi:hypothetical protein
VWRNAFGGNMVPLVWSHVVDYQALLPPHSYINVADYSSLSTFAIAIKEISTVRIVHTHILMHDTE